MLDYVFQDCKSGCLEKNKKVSLLFSNSGALWPDGFSFYPENSVSHLDEHLVIDQVFMRPDTGREVKEKLQTSHEL